MKKQMMFAIILLTIVLLMATFGFSLDGTPPKVLPATISGQALFVCPAASSFWDSMAHGFAHFGRYVLMFFFFVSIVLAFVWGWALYQNLLKDAFNRDSFAKPWGFTKLAFWAAIVMLLVFHTPNHYRLVEVENKAGNWVLCENTSPGAQVVNSKLVSAK